MPPKVTAKEFVASMGDVSQATLSEVFGVDRKAVIRWIEAGMPVTTKRAPHRINLADACRWREEWWRDRLQELKDHKSTGGKDDEFEKRWRKARAEKMEIANARERAQLIPIELVQEIIESLDGMTVRSLKNLSKELPPILSSAKDERDIRNEIDRSVRALCESRLKVQSEWFESLSKRVLQAQRETAVETPDD